MYSLSLYLEKCVATLERCVLMRLLVGRIFIFRRCIMKLGKIIISCLLVFIIAFSVIVFSSCDNKEKFNEIVEISLGDKKEHIDTINGIEFRFKYKPAEHYQSFYIDVNIKNTNIEALKLTVGDIYAVRESNGAKYKCSYVLTTTEIECDKSTSFNIWNYNLPVVLDENNFYVEMTISDVHFKLKLYETDSSYRKEAVISTSTNKSFDFDEVNIVFSVYSNDSKNGLFVVMDINNKLNSTFNGRITNIKIFDMNTSVKCDIEVNTNDYGFYIDKNMKRTIIFNNTQLKGSAYQLSFEFLDCLFVIKIM